MTTIILLEVSNGQNKRISGGVQAENPAAEDLPERNGFADSTWIRGLVIDARDPVTGREYLDRNIRQILASVPAERRVEFDTTRRLSSWHLYFVSPDRDYETIFALELFD